MSELPPTPALPADYADDEDLTVKGDWRITDLGSADWALLRLGDCQAELERAVALEREAIARVKVRAAALEEKAERGLRFFRSRLEFYATEHRAELLGGGKRKSADLMAGTVGWRSHAGGLEVTDPEALLAWCRAQPVESGCLRITEAPALAAVKAHAKKTGEVPDGCETKEDSEEFYATPNQRSLKNGASEDE